MSDHSQDVERLFSWLKAPMVHYREFTPQIEVAEAVATWPVAHRTAVETGLAIDPGLAPQGDVAARARLARERAMMPPAAAQSIRESPLSGPPTPGRQEDRPADVGLVQTLGERLRAEQAEAVAEPAPVRPAAEPAEPEPAMMTFEEPVPAAPPYRPEPRAAERVAPPPAGRQQGGLFAGEYRGREREARPEHPVADRHDRSLDAVFSRMSGARDGLPDPRARARTTPGLGAVFGRLR